MNLGSINNGVGVWERFMNTQPYNQSGRRGSQVSLRETPWKGTYKWKRIDEWELGLIVCEAYQHRTQGHFRIDLAKYETLERGVDGPGTFSTWHYKSTSGFERAWVVIRQNVLAILVTDGANWATTAIKTGRLFGE